MKKIHKPKLYRQGDVLVRLVSKLPDGEQKQLKADPKHKGFVLAYGEVTGHAHVIDSPEVKMVEIEGVSYLEVQAAVAALKHDEHATINLPKGTYQVVHQREYSPEEIRNVRD